MKQRHAVVNEPENQEPETPDKPKCWESFFRCQRNPVLRSQMLTALMAGTPLEAARIPTAALLDALLIAFAARTYCEAELVDDFSALMHRVDEEWKRPDWTTKVFDSLHGCAANFILLGSTEFAAIEERYIPEFVAWYINHDVPTYFDRELETDKDVMKFRRSA